MIDYHRVRKMQSVIEKMIKSMQQLTASKEFAEKHKREKQDFTRNRNLGFAETVYFVAGNLGTSLDFEVLNFCADRSSTVSPAAMCKARDKIQSSAFEEIFKESAKEVPVKHSYRGYRLTAYDGMMGELPRTPELMKVCNVSDKKGYPQFHTIAEYDVLNCCYTDAIFNLGVADERRAAIELFSRHSYEGKEIFLLDRGFPSLKLIQELNKSGKKYVMRVSKSFLKEVNDFGASKAKDKIIQIDYDKRRGATSRTKDVELPYSFQLRCVKIELDSGETEILITNLDKAEFSRKDIGELYCLRWKIETGFLNLKYAIRIEDFVGIKENSIKQEFFASLYKSNLFMQFVEVANGIVYNKKNDIA